MSVQIKEMVIDDYDEIFAMWQITTKRALSEADQRDEIARYLNRNQGMSQVAVVNGKIVGTVLAGHDGRRGFIHHMAVMPEYRRHHIGQKLAQTAVEKIKAEKIAEVYIFSFRDNTIGQSFWKKLGFEKRDDVFV